MGESGHSVVRISGWLGLPVVQDGKTTFPMAPAEFASFVPKLIAAGAGLLGGCCGSTPDHIRAIRQAVDASR